MNKYRPLQFDFTSEYAINWNVEAVKGILSKTEFESDNLGCLLDYYVIGKLFKESVFTSRFSTEEYEEYNTKAKEVTSIVKKYFNTRTEEELQNLFFEIGGFSRDSFLDLFSEMHLYKKLSPELFLDVLKNQKQILKKVLERKRLVNHYGKVIKIHVLENPKEYVKLFLKHCFVDEKKTSEKLYFPVEINKVDTVTLLKDFIEISTVQDDSYLKLVVEAFPVEEVKISEELKKMAKEKREENYQKLKESDSYVIKSGIQIQFSKNQKENIKVERNLEKNEIYISYSRDFLEQHIEDHEILGNFIKAFQFVNSQFCYTILKKNEFSLLDLFVMKGKKEYNTTQYEEMYEQSKSKTLEMYYKLLREKGIRLEEVLERHVNGYLNKLVTGTDFFISLSSPETTYLEKCRMIFPEIESLLKQFSMFVKTGKIDPLLLELSSGSERFQSIGSVIKDKYYYGFSDVYTKSCHNLFDLQSNMGYLSEELCENSLKELLYENNIRKEEFPEHHQKQLLELIQHGLIQANKSKYLKLTKKAVILYIIYSNGVWCTNDNKDYHQDIKELKEKSVIQAESTLFTRDESDFLDYCLNNSNFSNGYSLRNTYAHGSNTRNKEKQKQDYFIFLKLLIFIVLKITNELSVLYQEIERRENSIDSEKK